ncbi:Fc.00g043750.m01.CDS01 [Cosmosporella sp. VM-42]
MARISLLVLLIGAFVSLVAAASAPVFCKCTCGKNSTIIPLGPEHQSDTDNPSLLRRANIFNPDILPQLPGEHKSNAARNVASRSKSTSCSECTKAFCLSQGIDFCKGVEEDDVTTMCFQRDSNKDKIIVWGFIVGTVGLLGWAAFKRVLEWREGKARHRHANAFAPIPGNFR